MHCAFCYLPTIGHAVSNEPRKTQTPLVTHLVSASKNKKCERVHFTREIHFTSKLHQVLKMKSIHSLSGKTREFKIKFDSRIREY